MKLKEQWLEIKRLKALHGRTDSFTGRAHGSRKSLTLVVVVRVKVTHGAAVENTRSYNKDAQTNFS